MSQQSGLVAGNKQNEAGGTVPHNRSRFPLSKSFFCTERFADYSPSFVMEGVSGDRITLNQPHQVRTYTLKAPLMQDILKKKDYFMVPMQAILPLNWEKFYTNPTIGDDVPDGVGCGLLNFWSRLKTVFSSDWLALHGYLNTAANTDNDCLERIIKFFVYYEQFYSNGSLLKYLHNSGSSYFRAQYLGITGKNLSPDYDWFFDEVCNILCNTASGIDYFVCTLNGISYSVMCGARRFDENELYYQTNVLTFRQFLEMVREDLATFSITGITNISTSGWRTSITSLLDDTNLLLPAATDVPLNFARLAAYQLVVAHYYSNDHIDVLYSAELYREYMNSLYVNTFTNNYINSANVTFLYNGVRYNYDSLSAWVVNRMFITTGTPSFTQAFTSVFSKGQNTIAYICSLFGFKRSLRFMDYFTGSRAFPLAVGNETTIDTSGSNVSVIDVTRKFQFTRFYQAINRSGRKFSAYMKEMFGKVPAPDYHNPFYLAHTSDVVGGQETENTGAAQVSAQSSVTSVLRSNASRYAFTFEPDRDCIILGITYYDLPRVYKRATERQFFDVSRFDMFNPFLQYLGDQPIYKAELGVGDMSETPFSYCNRDMQYKQMYNQAAGGFSAQSTQLDNWFFPAEVLRRPYKDTIGSSFIRSFSSEFDRFYVSLTGYSLGTYFHFIVRYDDRLDASRPMAYAPGILQ